MLLAFTNIVVLDFQKLCFGLYANRKRKLSNIQKKKEEMNTPPEMRNIHTEMSSKFIALRISFFNHFFDETSNNSENGHSV